LRFTEKRKLDARRPERYASVSASATVPRKFPTPYGREAVKVAVRPKKLSEWERLRMETLNRAVAPVMGTVPSKIMFPSKKEYVKLTAFVCRGVMT
jgi:hypothetical protein